MNKVIRTNFSIENVQKKTFFSINKWFKKNNFISIDEEFQDNKKNLINYIKECM